MTTTTKYYKVRIYVGPVHVDHYVAQARANGLTDVEAGTQHVWGVAASPELRDDTDRLCLQQRVADLVYGAPMAAGWRDVELFSAR
jgi:hypothetical protein